MIRRPFSFRPSLSSDICLFFPFSFVTSWPHEPDASPFFFFIPFSCLLDTFHIPSRGASSLSLSSHARSSQLAKLLLVLADVGDLLCGGGGLVEAQLNPLVDELLGQLEADDALAEAQHLRIVGQHAALHAVRVVRGHRPDALDFVGGDGDAQPRAADQEGAVGLYTCDSRQSLGLRF